MRVEQLSRVFEHFNSQNGVFLRDFNPALGNALGWDRHGASFKPQKNIESFSTNQAMLANEPAFLFVAANRPLTKDVINLSASYAYHSSIEWGLVANSSSGIIFNSHWLKNNDWFALPELSWQNLDVGIGLLSSATPAGIFNKELEKLAIQFSEPDDFLQPVDDALVDRLDFWRDEAVRFANSLTNIDEKLQTLFAQLFVIRAVEDRKLTTSRISLEDYISSQDEAVLNRVFAKARKEIQSELFADNVHGFFPPEILTGIIRDMYYPHSLPRNQNRYNFSWLSADLLGRAYEKYLSNILVPTPLSRLQPKLFNEPFRDVERVSVRKKSGIFYTPSYLVSYLTETSLDHFFSAAKEGEIPTIGDFSCGSGSFLTQAADLLISKLRQFDANKNWGREIVSQRKIIGIDNDERAVTLAKLSLWLRLTEEPNPLPLPALNRALVFGNALSDSTFKQLPKSYDIVVGNPPFIATGKIENRNLLAKKFLVAEGRFDYSSLFIELAIRKLKNSGFLALVVPNRLFQNVSSAPTRNLITDRMDLLTLIDFGSNEVFSNTSAYIGALIAKKDGAHSNNNVRVIKVGQISESYMSSLLFNSEFLDQQIREQYLEAFEIQHPTDNESWLFLSPKQKNQRLALEEASVPLSTIAGIYQGIKTGANDFFLVEKRETDSHFSKVLNGYGEEFIVESSLLRPAIYGADINRYEDAIPTKYLLYPYENNQLISEERLEQGYPKIYQYLLYYRNILSDRKSIQASGLKWYELVRKRESTWLNARKLITRDLAIKPSFGIDLKGHLHLIGGTAVVIEDPDLFLLVLGYLNSSITNRYLSGLTSAFKSGFQKYEPHHIQSMPIPLKALKAKSDLISDLVQKIIEACRDKNDNYQAKLEDELDKELEAAIRE